MRSPLWKGPLGLRLKLVWLAPTEMTLIERVLGSREPRREPLAEGAMAPGSKPDWRRELAWGWVGPLH